MFDNLTITKNQMCQFTRSKNWQYDYDTIKSNAKCFWGVTLKDSEIHKLIQLIVSDELYQSEDIGDKFYFEMDSITGFTVLENPKYDKHCYIYHCGDFYHCKILRIYKDNKARITIEPNKKFGAMLIVSLNELLTIEINYNE